MANDRIYARRTYTPADHTLLVTNRYRPHPITNTLRGRSHQNPLVVLTSGALVKGRPGKGVSLTDVVGLMPGTWADKNRDYRFNPNTEKRVTPLLGVAVSGLAGKPAPKPKASKKSRGQVPSNAGTAIVFADADLTSNLVLRNRANYSLLVATINWLAGDETAASAPETEEDIQILHASSNELAWFYVPVFVVPLLVLLLGGYMAHRRGKPQQESAHG